MMQTFTHIILDEIHERTVSTEFTLLVVRKFAIEYPDVKIILMSATLQGGVFVDYFDQVLQHTEVAKPYFVGAKRYKVDTYFLNNVAELSDKISLWHDKQITAAAAVRKLTSKLPKKNVHELHNIKPVVSDLAVTVCTELIISQANKGESTLVFLPGIAEIVSYKTHLIHELSRRNISSHFTCFVLHSQVPIEDQSEVFNNSPSNSVHIILATNIAESSLTLPKLRMVINFGLYRQLQYDSKLGISRLHRMWCSRAACAQRAGRVGRVFEGVIVHMFTLRFYQVALPEYSPPEIVTAPLAKLVLQAKSIASKLWNDNTH